MLSSHVSQNVKAFEARHTASGDPAVLHKGWLLFSDGGMREENPLGPLCEPPTDPHELAKAKAHYWQVVFDRAIEDFDAHKSALKLHASTAARTGCYPPADESLIHLQKLQTATFEAMEKVDAADAEVQATEPKSWAEARAAKAARQELGAEFAAKVAKITV